VLKPDPVWANLRQQVASPDAWWRDDKAPEDRPRTPQDSKAIIAWWEQQVGVMEEESDRRRHEERLS
jgi:hypothetical protein